MVAREINLDLERAARTGLPEHIYCASKSLDQLHAILTQIAGHSSPLLLTRLEAAAAAALSTSFDLSYDATSKTATFQWTAKIPVSGRVAVVCGDVS
jgi:NCAIR mutase (PurE)-related protein